MRSQQRLRQALLLAVALILPAASFAPRAATTTRHAAAHHHQMTMMDPTDLLTASAGVLSSGLGDASQWMEATTASSMLSSSNLLSFADQGQNLAGIFFQASLLPYLLFLYFLSFRANRISDLGNFGFQFVLLFVLSTIPSGIITKSTYGQSLANTDWLHGGAELLLTMANVFIVSACLLKDQVWLQDS